MTPPGFLERQTSGSPRLWLAERPGREPALLLAHGNSGTSAVWDLLLPLLSDRRVAVVDLRGHGRSERAAPPAYATCDYADDLAAAVAELGGPPTVLVAHSNAALAALHLAARRPAWLRGVVHVDIDPRPPDWQVRFFHDRAGAAARAYASTADLAERMRAVDPTVPGDVFERYVAEIVEPAGGGVRLRLDPETYASWQPEDTWPALPAIDRPLLVVRGEESLSMAPETPARMVELAPRARAATIPGAGHYPMLGRPELLAAEIGRFLDALEGG